MKLICLFGHNWQPTDHGWMKMHRCLQCGKLKATEVDWAKAYGHRAPQ